MQNYYSFTSILIAITAIICFIRVLYGPSKADRIIGINIIGTKTIVLIAIMSFIMKETYFLDVVIVYALINFLASAFISRDFYEEGYGEDEKC
jgi:multicomponent Na+:H+ antiporter subunit F